MKWLPSVANVHADRLSRTWDPRDLQLSRRALTLVKGIFSHIHGPPVFSYRKLRAHPIPQRKAAIAALNQDWGDGLGRLFNPPVDLVSLTLYKIEKERAKGILVVPDWPNQLWYSTARRLSRTWDRIPLEGARALCGARSIRNCWKLAVAEIGQER